MIIIILSSYLALKLESVVIDSGCLCVPIFCIKLLCFTHKTLLGQRTRRKKFVVQFVTILLRISWINYLAHYHIDLKTNSMVNLSFDGIFWNSNFKHIMCLQFFKIYVLKRWCTKQNFDLRYILSLYFLFWRRILNAIWSIQFEQTF